MKNTVGRWYRTVYIAWLIASYDTHKGKRFQNFNPPSYRGKKSPLFSPLAHSQNLQLTVLTFVPEVSLR